MLILFTMIITIGNTKGGVGKSTIATNLVVESSTHGKKSLLIDADIQGSSLAFRATREKDDIKAMAITTATLHKDVRDFVFDVIIIDVGGRDSSVFRSAIMACDIMIIPILPSQYDIWAANDTVEILKEARAFIDIPAYFILNQVIPNTIIAREAKAAINDFSNDVKLLDTFLYSRVAYKNSTGQGMGVSEYEKDGKSAQEVKQLYREVMTIRGGVK